MVTPEKSLKECGKAPVKKSEPAYLIWTVLTKLVSNLSFAEMVVVFMEVLRMKECVLSAIKPPFKKRTEVVECLQRFLL